MSTKFNMIESITKTAKNMVVCKKCSSEHLTITWDANHFGMCPLCFQINATKKHQVYSTRTNDKLKEIYKTHPELAV